MLKQKETVVQTPPKQDIVGLDESTDSEPTPPPQPKPPRGGAKRKGSKEDGSRKGAKTSHQMKSGKGTGPTQCEPEEEADLKKTIETVFTCKYIPGCKRTGRWVPTPNTRQPLSCTLHRQIPDHGYNWYQLKGLKEPPASPQPSP